MSADTDVVTFTANDVVYGVPVVQVREILEMRPPVLVPQAPRHLIGSIDIRGESLVVVDLRTMLGLPRGEDTAQTRILVVWVARGGRRSPVGLRADRVIEVLRLDGPVEPLVGADMLGWSGGGVNGIGRKDGAPIGILDLAQLLAAHAATGPEEAAA